MEPASTSSRNQLRSVLSATCPTAETISAADAHVSGWDLKYERTANLSAIYRPIYRPPPTISSLIGHISAKEPPARFAAGADALQTLEGKAKALLAQANAYRDLSSSLTHSDG